MAGLTLNGVGFVGSLGGPAAVVATGYDADAQAFITAAGLTDPAQQAAVNRLTLDLKNGGVWAKANAIYPVVGGTAAAHSYNLKDPRPLAAAFYLAHTASVVHSAGGMQYAGSGSSSNTQLVMPGLIPLASVSVSLYSRIADTTTGNLISPVSGSGSAYLQIVHVFGSALLVWDCYGTGGSGRATASNVATTQGFVHVNRSSLTSSEIYRNGALLSTTTVASGTDIGSQPPTALILGNLTNAQIAFAHIGTSLIAAEQTALATAVQNYQTALGRQV